MFIVSVIQPSSVAVNNVLKLQYTVFSISCLAEDDKNNQFLQNDGTSQKVSRDEIMNLKAQGVSGKVRLKTIK